MNDARLRSALCCAVVAAALVPRALAQGVLRKEENAYRYLTERRLELVAAWPSLDDAQRQQLCQDLVGEDAGVPFRPVLRALARLAGREADAAWMARGSLGAFALPEVVDPEGANPFCRDLHVTLYLPYKLPGLGEDDVTLGVSVWTEGEDPREVWSGAVDEAVGVGDLLRYQGRVTVPCGELDDGAYRARVRATVAGVAPGPRDPQLELRFDVLRGFQARAEAVLESVGEGLDPGSRAHDVWAGFAMPVSRAYFGREGAPLYRPVADLKRVEDALAARDAGEEPVLTGTGWVTVGVPGGAERAAGVPPIQLRLRLPAAGQGTPVLLLPGAPTYASTGRRPGGPRTTDPAWIAGLVDGVEGLTGPVAVLESSGRTGSAVQDLEAALEYLRGVWGERRVALVAEREAAVVASLAVAKVRDRLAALVLIGAGSVFRDRLGDFVGLPVRMIPEHGTPAARNLGGTRRLLAGAYGDVPEGLRFEVDDREVPFSLGLGVFLPDLPGWLKGL